MSEYLDEDGYPTDEALEKIENWPYTDLAGLMDFVESLWHFGDWGWKQIGNKFYVSTGGWSGNEDIIAAMRRNIMFWMLCWQSSRRGGHYVFEVPSMAESEGSA